VQTEQTTITTRRTWGDASNQQKIFWGFFFCIPASYFIALHSKPHPKQSTHHEQSRPCKIHLHRRPVRAYTSVTSRPDRYVIDLSIRQRIHSVITDVHEQASRSVVSQQGERTSIRSIGCLFVSQGPYQTQRFPHKHHIHNLKGAKKRSAMSRAHEVRPGGGRPRRLPSDHNLGEAVSSSCSHTPPQLQQPPSSGPPLRNPSNRDFSPAAPFPPGPAITASGLSLSLVPHRLTSSISSPYLASAAYPPFSPPATHSHCLPYLQQPPSHSPSFVPLSQTSGQVDRPRLAGEPYLRSVTEASSPRQALISPALVLSPSEVQFGRLGHFAVPPFHLTNGAGTHLAHLRRSHTTENLSSILHSDSLRHASDSDQDPATPRNIHDIRRVSAHSLRSLRSIDFPSANMDESREASVQTLRTQHVSYKLQSFFLFFFC
jgi:hypothetical protein